MAAQIEYGMENSHGSIDFKEIIVLYIQALFSLLLAAWAEREVNFVFICSKNATL